MAIKVKYKYVDGAHFFVPDDERALGLCVAHADLKTAYDEVGAQLSALHEMKGMGATEFKPAIPFEVFSKWVADSIASATPKLQPLPASIINWQMERDAA